MRGYGQQELGWEIQQLAAHWAEKWKGEGHQEPDIRSGALFWTVAMITN